MFEFQWILTTSNEADMFMFYLGGLGFNKLCKSVCVSDNYVLQKQKTRKTPAHECERVLHRNYAFTL